MILTETIVRELPLSPSSSKPTALVLSYSNLASDPRVSRQLGWLQDDHQLVTVGTGAPGIPVARHVNADFRPKRALGPKLLSALYGLVGRFDAVYWRRDYALGPAAELADLRPDVVIANDIDTLPLALKLAHGAPVIFDAHEYAPREVEDNLRWQLMVAPLRRYLCRTYMPKAQARLTVCQGIADEYRREFGVDCRVLTNAPADSGLPVRPTDPARIRIIHHGIASVSRKLENMIDLAGRLDGRFRLDFMLMDQGDGYLARLQEMAKPLTNVRFLPPVPMPAIVDTIADYDIGLFLLEPTNFNYAMALPNKLFEFLQARLAVAIGPSPEMARIVKDFDCGIVADDFRPETLAVRLNALTADDIDRFKQGSARAAAVHNAEANRAIFRGLLASVRG